jgi:hypothetical protein
MVKMIEPFEIETAIRALVAAEKTNMGIEVSLPVAYGDGEIVSVIAEPVTGGFNVHDGSAGAIRLSAAGVHLSAAVTRRLREFASRYRCQFAEGRVQLSADAESLPRAVCLVANASRSVADYVFEIRRQADYDFRTVVVDALREIVGSRARPYEEFKGKSGRIYRLPVILDRDERAAQNFIAPLAHRYNVPNGFGMLYDLGLAFPHVERDAVYDESSDIRPEDRTFLASAGAKVMNLMEAPTQFRAAIDGLTKQ